MKNNGNVIDCNYKCASGHGVLKKTEITFPTPNGDFSFPVNYFRPNDHKKHDTFVLMNFRPDPYDMYVPAEEIIDNGFGVAVICYKDITSDDGDFSDKLSGFYPRKNDGTDWGKIGMWAFAMSRAADYLLTRNEVSGLIAIGHSRLGKTALWCGAQDERFKAVISNDSGCSGAAYERVKQDGAETKKIIAERFPFWFCENHNSCIDDIPNMPFDQHFLLSLIAPRILCIGSASLDIWADPYAEQLSCIGATPAWSLYNKPGYLGTAEPMETNQQNCLGMISYHLRDGIHFLGRADWNYYMNAIKAH